MNKAYIKYEPRTALYRIPAENARQMYKNRPASEKNTPFKEYIKQCANDDHIRWPITEVELV